MLVWAMLDCFDQQRSRVTDLDGVIKMLFTSRAPGRGLMQAGEEGRQG